MLPRESHSKGQAVLLAMQIVLVAGVGIAAGQSLLSMLRPVPRAHEGPAPDDEASLPPMPAALPAEGTWTLGDSPLSLGVEIVESDELAERMAVPPPETPQTAATSPLIDAFLFSSIQSACKVNEAIGGYAVYELDQPRMKLRLFSTGSADRERLVGGYLAYPREPGSWTLVVGTAGRPEVTGSERAHLLPLTDSAGSVGARVGRDGTLQCEIVEACGDLAGLWQRWRDAGWMISRSPEEAGRDFFSCIRGARQVQVHVHRNPNEGGRWVLFLVDTHSLLDIEGVNLWTERASR